MILCLCACGAPAPGGDAPAADTDLVAPADTDADPCADYTWETVAQPFVLTWCTPCHSADVKGDLRQGAPATINFDTEAEVLELAQEMKFVAAGTNPTMPPSSGPDAATRARFALWVGCVVEPR